MLADGAAQWMNFVHKSALALSGGRLGAEVWGMTVLELHTTGRRSGKRRSTMLTAPVVDGDEYVIVASKGGDDRHPDWFRNLEFEPDVEITVRNETRPMRARVVTGAERAELWERIVKKSSNYRDYQRRTDREIPVVVLAPR